MALEPDSGHVEHKKDDVDRRHAVLYHYDTVAKRRLLIAPYPLVRIRPTQCTTTSKAIGWLSNVHGKERASTTGLLRRTGASAVL